MLITKEVLIKWNFANRKNYENKGYKFTKYGDEIKVKIKDLADGSHVPIKTLCDYCLEEGKETIITKSYYGYLKSRKYIQKDCCRKCCHKKVIEANMVRIGVKSPFQLKEVKQKIRETHMERYGFPNYTQSPEYSQKYSNENSSNWQGGKTSNSVKIRNSKETDKWRSEVFKRDNYTCQICGDNRGANLQAHHIKSFSDYIDFRFDVNNGIALCNNCHDSRIVGSFHNIYGLLHNTKEQLMEYIIKFKSGELDKIREDKYIKIRNKKKKYKKISTLNKSGFLGVYYLEKSNKWTANLGKNKIHYHLGTFKYKEQAIKTRMEAELFYYGKYVQDFSNVNLDFSVPKEEEYKKISSRNNSGYIGVYYSKKYDKWLTQIVVNSKTIHIGTYLTKEKAIEARKESEIKYYGKTVQDFKDELIEKR